MTMPLEYTHKLIQTTPLHKPQIYPQLPRTLQIWQHITSMHLVPNTHIIHALHIHKITPPPPTQPSCKYRSTETQDSHLWNIHQSHKSFRLALNTSKDTHTAPEKLLHRKAKKHTTCYKYTNNHPKDKDRFGYLKYMKSPTGGERQGLTEFGELV